MERRGLQNAATQQILCLHACRLFEIENKVLILFKRPSSFSSDGTPVKWWVIGIPKRKMFTWLLCLNA
jgi:hypothetical protein